MGKKKLFMKNTIGGVIPPVVTIPLENIISEYKFEDNVLDTVGSNNGTATSITYEAGTVGQRGVFNGSTSFVSVPNASDFNFTEGGGVDKPFSISLLATFDTTSNSSALVNKYSAGSNAEFSLIIFGSKLNMGIFESDNWTDYISREYDFTRVVGQVYHISMTYDGSKSANGIKLYIDGLEVVSTDISIGSYTGLVSNTAPILIGKRTLGTQHPHDGTLDCVRIWNKQLSSSEINLIATDELAGIDINPQVIPLTTNLVASYSFDTDFSDYTGNHPLTAYGNAIAGVTGGKVSDCAELDGTDDYTVTADSSDFSFTNNSNDLPFSFSFWANFNTVPVNSLVVPFSKTTYSGIEYIFSYFGGDLYMALYSQSLANVSIVAKFSFLPVVGDWNHITITYDGSSVFSGIKPYINGVSIPTTSLNEGTYLYMVDTPASLNIGSQGWIPTDGEFDGKLDEFHIWKNRELTQSEVTNIYNTENAGNSILPLQIPLQNIISQWKFEDNVLDTVGTNDGTPTALTYANGLVNRTGVFNGSANVSLTTLPIPTDEFSISFLAKTSGTSEGRIVGWSNWSGYTRIEFNSGGTLNRIGYVVNDGTGGASIVVDGYDLTDWIHIVVTAKANNSSKIYVNGVYGNGNLSLQGFVSIAGNNYIGSNRNGNASLFQGDIDCVRIWNKELSPAEITLLATDELAGIDINP